MTAVSKLNLIKKNELLTLIKDDLKKTSEEGNRSLKSVITTINKNINEEDTWNVFREAFKLTGTPIRVELRTGENPFKGRKNPLTKRQVQKRKRLKKFLSRK